MTTVSGSSPTPAPARETATQQPSAAPEVPIPKRRPRRRQLIVAVLIGWAIAVGALPAYRWWHGYRTGQYSRACAQAVQAESWDRLELAASRWAEWDPRSSDAWVYLAEARVQQSELSGAAEALGRVSDSYHGALQALGARAELQFSDLNLPEAAAGTWQRMLRINPRADVARQRLIYYYALSLQRSRLIAAVGEAIRQGCEPPEAYMYLLTANDLNFSDGLSTVSKWRLADPDDETLEVAQAVYAAKRTRDRGMPMFGTGTVAPGDQGPINACLAKYPSNLEVLAFHIEKAVFEGQSERVAELLGQSPDAAERDSRFWRHRGWLLATRGRHREAEASFRRALDLHPFDWQSRLMLADALRHLEQTDEADDMARLARVGKELQTRLFERPNARDLDPALAAEIQAYVERTGPPFVALALARRL